jgi:hypothetical protein
MADLSDMVRAVRTIKTSKGEYKLATAGVRELGLLEKWAKRQPDERLKERLNLLGKTLKAEERMALIEAASKEAKDKEILKREVESVQGYTQFVLYCFRIEHPKMSLEECEEIITEVGLEKLKALAEEDSQVEEGNEPAGAE